MSIFIPRGQPPDGDGINGNDAWWWSTTAEALKWGVIAAIFIIFILCLVGAYMHAMRRMKKGLQPLPYHRWLVRRHRRASFAARNQNNFSFYGQQDGYNMPSYAAPPPAYNAEHNYVPVYTPPQDGSKTKTKDETTREPTVSGPSQPPAVANPSRPIHS